MEKIEAFKIKGNITINNMELLPEEAERLIIMIYKKLLANHKDIAKRIYKQLKDLK